MTERQGNLHNYVVGFAFNCLHSQVALILKNKPEWQAGLYNGIGGKIEPGEHPRQAMVREFYEECGIHTPRWMKRGVMLFDDAHVHVFSATLGDADIEPRIQQKTDERVDVFAPLIPPSNMIPNLRWLIPLCMDERFVGRFETREGHLA